MHPNHLTNSYQNMCASSDPSATRRPLLDVIKERVEVVHKMTTELHQIADRMVGIRDVPQPDKISAVPNGCLEEIADSLDGLQDRLHGLHERLSRA